jgi:hypothetical protein
MATITKAAHTKEKNTVNESAAHLDHPGRSATTVEMTLAGAVAGAATGALAGPIGAIAGGVIGTVAGALAGNALSEDDEIHSRKDAELDEEIGVSGGDMGSIPPGAPKKPTRGTISAASAGVGSGGGGATPSEGPMQDIDSDD